MTELTELPEPYEGIYAVDRGDTDLLSLDARARPHRDALLAMGTLLHRATLAGHPAPVVAALEGRISRPVPGDLVVELSSRHLDPGRRLMGLGVLLAQRHEWADTGAEWEQFCARETAISADPDVLELITSLDNRCTARAWYIQYGPGAGPATPGPGSGDVCRWTGATFAVLPVDVTSRWLEAEADKILAGCARLRPRS